MRSLAIALLAGLVAGAVAPALPAAAAAPAGRLAASAAIAGPAQAAVNGDAPAWILCPPPDAAGIAAVLAGTDLACAP